MEEKKKKKTTTKAQFELMVDEMTKNSNIAKNVSKRSPVDVQQYWDELQIKLNSLGPPMKDSTSWKKTWADYKSNIKKKLSLNKAEFNKTGGGPNKTIDLTDTESAVVGLVNIKEAVEGIKGTKKFGIITDDDVQMTSINIGDEEIDEVFETPVAKRARVHQKINAPEELLRKQIIIQDELVKNVTSSLHTVNEGLKDISNGVKRVYRALEERNKNDKKHQHQMEILLEKKLDIKAQMLEIEKSKYD